MDTTNKIIPAENCHYYDRAGNPVYEVLNAKGDKMIPTTLSHARKLDLLPGYTRIESVAAKPGLEIWKLAQLLHAALTLPQHSGETVDEYAERVIEDSRAQSAKAIDRGKELHAAIEKFVLGDLIVEWAAHIYELEKVLLQHGIELRPADAEKTFASNEGYGGKLDWIRERTLMDFKTKDRIEEN